MSLLSARTMPPQARVSTAPGSPRANRITGRIGGPVLLSAP